MQFVGVYLIVTALIKLSKSWFALQDATKRLIKLESLNSQTELQALKAQINPHFLFNNLHSIYALALENHPKTPTIILKLSDVLRFMLYDTEGDAILLKKELDCIQDYLSLQRIRLPENVDISFDRHGSNGDVRIAPLLLMTLVENSFKHGILTKDADSFVRVRSFVENRHFSFEIENSRFEQDEKDIKNTGIGLSNLKRRLALVYPKRHSIQFEETENRYKVSLKINL
jgi:LytS/YehU family sensor histidine kinase